MNVYLGDVHNYVKILMEDTDVVAIEGIIYHRIGILVQVKDQI